MLQVSLDLAALSNCMHHFRGLLSRITQRLRVRSVLLCYLLYAGMILEIWTDGRSEGKRPAGFTFETHEYGSHMK